MATILEKTAGLLAFVRTVDAGSFAGAARLIGASPSAVSKSVARGTTSWRTPSAAVDAHTQPDFRRRRVL
jgi:Bacterial regulatory helix-turn-helix protein, lysR family